jgi:hypothetical protein
MSAGAHGGGDRPRHVEIWDDAAFEADPSS